MNVELSILALLSRISFVKLLSCLNVKLILIGRMARININQPIKKRLPLSDNDARDSSAFSWSFS